MALVAENMRILHTTPVMDGYRMPAEYEEHTGCIMVWPERADSWQYGAVAARKAFVQVAEAIALSEKVIMLTSNAQYDNARAMLSDKIQVIEMTTDDAWARDFAPTFVINEEGSVRGIDWQFNAWGGEYDGLYDDWSNDNKVARKMCDILEKDVYDASDFVLEGGAIHVDGEGTALVTKACLLSKGRNPDMSMEQIENKLKDYLNVSKVIWINNGIYNDETNEHIDNICAFARPGEILLAVTDDINDPQYSMSQDAYNTLINETDARGRKIKVHKIPLPKPVYLTDYERAGLSSINGFGIREEHERLAASYVNFYISNKNIIMPGFGDDNDEVAKNIIQDIFKDREVIQIYSRDILIGGGNIHCITQQIPKGIKR